MRVGELAWPHCQPSSGGVSLPGPQFPHQELPPPLISTPPPLTPMQGMETGFGKCASRPCLGSGDTQGPEIQAGTLEQYKAAVT